MKMELEIITPLEIVRVDGVDSVSAEGLEGGFTILPRHGDYVSALSVSIFSFRRGREEVFFGLDEGVLTKVGRKVAVSAHAAVRGKSLSDLRREMERHERELDEGEIKTKMALASLEGGIAHLMLELKEQG
ncbi:MAG: F0F1 ATP synthase subunit epsilon [Rickettsiales bacterium]|jgi:F-type H+-transporting ATPase subunit epsilon|nr:F0F1 ATP synthase subunit epsilon [Rickettsiales bacterium]